MYRYKRLRIFLINVKWNLWISMLNSDHRDGIVDDRVGDIIERWVSMKRYKQIKKWL